MFISKMTKDIRTIVHESGMSDRPGYYSGRGATLTDLNGDTLEKFYQNIEKSIGEEAAQNFVQMVANIPKLSATDFLLTLYNLERNNWKWDSKLIGNEKGNYAESEGEAMGNVLSVLGGMSERNETYAIRSRFLEEHLK